MNWFQKLLAKFFKPKPKIEWKSEDFNNTPETASDEQFNKLNGRL